MKKLLLFFLTILIPTIAAADESGICGDYVIYLYSSDTNTLTISGTGAMTDYENHIDVPWWKYRDKINTVIVEEGITRIGNINFDSNTNLTSVSLPGSLESIGLRAFAECSSLESLELPANIKVIEDKAFTGCTSLKTVNLPSGLSKINYGSFAHSGLVTVTIPEGVEAIGESAFGGCENLVSVSIPNSVTSIECGAFQNCENLSSAEIPNNVIDIGSYAFNGCSLTSVYIHEGVKSIGFNPFSDCRELKSIVVDKNNPYYDSREDCNAIIETQSDKIIAGTSNTIIPESVTSIDIYAFAGCGNLKEISLSDRISSIGSCAFQNCVSLTSIRIPKGVSVINSRTFSGCTSLTTLTITENVTSIGYDAFSTDNLKEIFVLAKNPPQITSWPYSEKIGNCIITVPDGCSEAYNKASYWSSLGTIVEASGFKLMYIVDGEIYKIIKLQEGANVTPEPAPTREGYTFSGWSDIPSTMPDHDVTVTGTFTINKYKLIYKVDGEVYKEYEIEYGASITPESEPTKEGYEFSGWSWIPNKMPAEDVIITGTFTKSAFKLIYIVDGEVYKTISYDYGASITPEADPTKEGYTFSGWSDVPSTMPANDVTVTGTFTINKYKLIYKVDGEVYKEYDIEYGASITPESEPTKEGYEFSGWSEIPPTMPAHDVVVTATFKQIDFNVDGIIYEISAEGNVTIMGGNQKGNLVIEGTIQINGQPYNVTAIAENAFRDNTNIISVTIADGITAIGDNAFNGCIGLLMINIGKNVATIGNKAFANIGTYTAARRRGESSLFVNCYTENVPQTALDAFENSPVESGTLLVDDNLVDSFKTSSPWSGFGKIQGFQEAAGINSIINSPQGARIYDLQGNRLDNIRKGVNIIRTKDGKAKKVMMK